MTRREWDGHRSTALIGQQVAGNADRAVTNSVVDRTRRGVERRIAHKGPVGSGDVHLTDGDQLMHRQNLAFSFLNTLDRRLNPRFDA